MPVVVIDYYFTKITLHKQVKNGVFSENVFIYNHWYVNDYILIFIRFDNFISF